LQDVLLLEVRFELLVCL